MNAKTVATLVVGLVGMVFSFIAGLEYGTIRAPRATDIPVAERPRATIKDSESQPRFGVASEVRLTESELLYRLQNVLHQPGSTPRDKEITEICREMGLQEGIGAFKYIEWLSGRDRQIAIMAILTGWVKADPDAAWDWALAAKQGGGFELRDTAPSQVANTLLILMTHMYQNGDGMRVPGLLGHMDNGPIRDLASAFHSRILAQYSPEEATNFVSSLEGAVSASARSAVAQELVKDLPVETADWALTAGRGSLIPVFSEWLGHDGQAAVAWAARQKPSLALDGALDLLVAQGSLDLLDAHPGILDLYTSPKQTQGAQAHVAVRKEAIAEQERRTAPDRPTGE